MSDLPPLPVDALPPSSTAASDKPKRKAGRPRKGEVVVPVRPPAIEPKKILRKPTADEARARIQTSHLLNRLQQHNDGLIEMSATQIKAAEILLSRSLPTLASIEVTNINANDKLTEAEIFAKLAGYFQADPTLLQRIQNFMANGVAPAAIEEVEYCEVVDDDEQQCSTDDQQGQECSTDALLQSSTDEEWLKEAIKLATGSTGT